MQRIELKNQEGGNLEFSAPTPVGVASFKLRYFANVHRWAISVDLNGRVITNAFIALETFILPSFPFDLYATSNDNIEPIFEDDFSSGRVSLHIISQEDKDALTAI